MSRIISLLKYMGPGLLFASSAIGTSHLVLSTRAGAHHGMIYGLIIIIALILKYPFYEFGPRYANATGFSLLKGYKDQGKWVVWLFIFIIFISMFAVTAAVGAVSAGLLATLFGVKAISVPVLSGVVIGCTVLMLLFGGFTFLDRFIKIVSLVLFITMLIAFIAVLINGPIEANPDFVAKPIFEGAGLVLLVSLLGWMPAGMEASTMNSIWTVEKAKSSGYKPTLSESLFDFKFGYVFTMLLAIMFMTIGAYTVYGTGADLGGNATVFTNKLIGIFTSNLGSWSYYVIAVAAFGTIYGTLITVMDAFPRCFVRAIRILKYDTAEKSESQQTFLNSAYKWTVVAVGLGGFLLFYFSASSMIQMLQWVTILSFLLSPIIAFINLRAVTSPNFPESYRPSKMMILLAYIGLGALLGFAFYYLFTMI